MKRVLFGVLLVFMLPSLVLASGLCPEGYNWWERKQVCETGGVVCDNPETRLRSWYWQYDPSLWCRMDTDEGYVYDPSFTWHCPQGGTFDFDEETCIIEVDFEVVAALIGCPEGEDAVFYEPWNQWMCFAGDDMMDEAYYCPDGGLTYWDDGGANRICYIAASGSSTTPPSPGPGLALKGPPSWGLNGLEENRIYIRLESF